MNEDQHYAHENVYIEGNEYYNIKLDTTCQKWQCHGTHRHHQSRDCNFTHNLFFIMTFLYKTRQSMLTMIRYVQWDMPKPSFQLIVIHNLKNTL